MFEHCNACGGGHIPDPADPTVQLERLNLTLVRIADDLTRQTRLDLTHTPNRARRGSR